jgi:hypothetical protein
MFDTERALSVDEGDLRICRLHHAKRVTLEAKSNTHASSYASYTSSSSAAGDFSANGE